MNRRNKNNFVFLTACSLLVLAGCANVGPNHTVIVDGGDLSHYESDLSACQELASTRGYINAETKADAGIGAGIGILAGAGGGLGEAIAGAAVGALVGGGSSALGARQEMKNIVIQCMQGRGYNTVEAVESYGG